jgi:hypothetical protein
MYISKEKKERISEQILAHLYLNNPKPLFTVDVAKEIARDEEFVKKLLKELKKKELVLQITKNPQGIDYIKRSRWKLSEKAYLSYRQKQSSN